MLNRSILPLSVITAVLLFAARADASPIQVGPVALDPPTLHTLGVVVPVTSGDDDHDAIATVRYRGTGTSDWSNAQPLLRVRPETVGNESPPGDYGLPMPTRMFAGSVFGLTENSSYDIEVTVTDPDGGGGVQLITGATRAAPRTAPANPVVIAVADNSQLAAALANAGPGHIIQIAAGNYRGPFTLSRSGTAANPIFLRGAGIGQVVVDATGATYGLTVSGSHVVVEEFTVSGSDWGARLSGADNIAVRRMRFRSVNKGIDGRDGSRRNFTICDNVLEGRFQWPDVSSATWDQEGIVVTGQGHVVCHNTLSGFGDALSLSQNTSLINVAIDFYGNDVLWTGDDGLELDYGHRNIRAFDNRVTNSGMGVSVQPSWGGPIYIFRNVLANQAHSPYKFNNDPTGILVLQNTSVRTRGPGNFGGWAWPQLGYQQSDGALSYVANFRFMNNIAIGATGAANFTSDIILGEIDWNGWSPDGTFVFEQSYANLADVKARSPFERNGRILSLPVFTGTPSPGADYTNFAAPADVTLRPASNAVNAGLVLPNINDGYLGGVPDLGGWESGRPTPTYGVRNQIAPPNPPTDLRAD